MSRTTRTGRGRIVIALGCLLAASLGTLIFGVTLREGVEGWSSLQKVVDACCGAAACVALGWRRRWPLGVALTCVVLGAFSISATPAGLVALFTLAVRRPARPALIVAALLLASALVFAAVSPTTDLWSLLWLTPLVLAVTAWGMYLRARRQVLVTEHERALRAVADQRLHEDRVRMAERTRIAREMHDVLAHRISLLALHAGGLEVRPDLPPAEVRETAALMRTTARQALEELRAVIGVLREVPGRAPALTAQPTLGEVSRLVEESRQAGADIDLVLRVEHLAEVPSALGRDAYRVVQESLTNIGKHATGAATEIRITGAPTAGLQVSVRNREHGPGRNGPTLPGSGAGLVGLRERVELAGGTFAHGRDAAGDFVVHADLPW